MKTITLIILLVSLSSPAWPDMCPKEYSFIKMSTTRGADPQRFGLVIERSDLASAPQWQIGKGEVPLSPARAIALAKAAIGPSAGRLNVPPLTFNSADICGQTYWYYVVRITIDQPEQASADDVAEKTDGDSSASIHDVVVLLSGKVILMSPVGNDF